jgi:hypothetical protein
MLYLSRSHAYSLNTPSFSNSENTSFDFLSINNGIVKGKVSMLEEDKG